MGLINAFVVIIVVALMELRIFMYHHRVLQLVGGGSLQIFSFVHTLQVYPFFMAMSDDSFNLNFCSAKHCRCQMLYQMEQRR